MSKFDQTNSLYNRFAKEFADKLDKIPETEQLDQFIKMLAEKATVLDLGCGSGRDAEYLSNAGLNVIGVDLSEGLINEARKRRSNIDFRVMDLEKLDFSENSFDGIWSKLTILHVDRDTLPGILKNLHKILKPGGVLFIETKAGEGEAYEKVSFKDDEERLFVYYELDELKKLFENSGFTHVNGYEYSVDNQHATHVKDRVIVFGRK